MLALFNRSWVVFARIFDTWESTKATLYIFFFFLRKKLERLLPYACFGSKGPDHQKIWSSKLSKWCGWLVGGFSTLVILVVQILLPWPPYPRYSCKNHLKGKYRLFFYLFKEWILKCILATVRFFFYQFLMVSLGIKNTLLYYSYKNFWIPTCIRWLETNKHSTLMVFQTTNVSRYRRTTNFAILAFS